MRTTHSRILGVVSMRAAVLGSLPAHAGASCGVNVAYCGASARRRVTPRVSCTGRPATLFKPALALDAENEALPRAHCRPRARPGARAGARRGRARAVGLQ